MKKIQKAILLLLCLTILCSCKEEVQKEGLIEISGQELTSNFYGDKDKAFIFAITNEHEKDTKKFRKDLAKLAEETNLTIYVTEYQHIDQEAATYIFNIYEANFTTNSYYVVKENELIVNKYYTNYNNMKADLYGHSYNKGFKFTSEKRIKETMEYVEKYYNEGHYALALNALNKIWDEEVAQDFYKEHPNLGIIQGWEHFIITKDKEPRITYRSLLFYYDQKFFFEILKKDYDEGFVKPNDIDDYTKNYYYIKDDIIYTSSKENGEYIKRFKIKEIEKAMVTLYDYKYKKDFKYSRRTTL